MGVARWCWLVLALAGALSQRSGQEPGQHWSSLTGEQWQRMGPDARWAYVQGFLAGAAVSQAAADARDTAGVRIALEQLRQSGRLRFPFGANVYASRLNDFYWWKNHLPLPTWSAFLEVNTTLGRPISDSQP